MALQTPVLVKTFPADTQAVLNTVLVASGTNAGNVAVPSAAGAMGIVGVSQQNFDNNNVGPVVLLGIAQCRFLTGTAVAAGDLLKIGDNAGRVTKFTPAAAGAGTLKGIVGRSLTAIAAGAASDTLIDVELAPCMYGYE